METNMGKERDNRIKRVNRLLVSMFVWLCLVLKQCSLGKGLYLLHACVCLGL